LTAQSVSKVRNLVEGCVGQKVNFKVRKGKNKSQVSEGIIADTYPSIFTVYVENKGVKRVMSFNYVDIVTSHVEFFLCNDDKTRII
jgi:uncharacterized protein Veg